MSGPRIGGLFEGYSGLTMGVQAVLGGELAWYSEVDKGALKVLSHRHPDVPNIGDVTTVDWSQVEPVDVLTGGFPCQDVSGAGKRAGIRPGTRSGLWSHFAYAIGQLRPRLVVIENVRGLLSAEAHSDVEPCPWCVGDDTDGALRALGAVLGDLASLGFDADWVGIRVADVGGPHDRFRVIITAYPQGERWTRPVESRALVVDDGSELAHARQDGRALLPTPDTGQSPNGHGRRGGRMGNGSQSGASLDAVAASLLPTPRTSDTNGPGLHGDGGLDLRTAVSLLPTPTTQDAANTGGPSQFDRNSVPLNAAVTLLPTPACNDMGAGKTVEEWDAWTAKMKDAHGNGNGHGPSLSIEAQRLLPTPNTGGGGQTSRSGERIDEPLIGGIVRDNLWGRYAEAIARWEALTRPAPPPTRPDGKGGNPRLNPEFSEWMQGLPAGWVTDPAIWEGWKYDTARNAQLHALGNGVCPQQAEAALRHLLTVMEMAA